MYNSRLAHHSNSMPSFTRNQLLPTDLGEATMSLVSLHHNKHTDVAKYLESYLPDNVLTYGDVDYIEHHSQETASRKKIKVFKSRWYVLTLFSSYVTMQYFIWNMFGPIASSVKKVFNWDNGDIANLANWDTILYVVFALQLCWLVKEKGLRRTFLISLVFVVVGSAFRCIAMERPFEAKWLMNTGQIFNGFGGVLAQAAGPLISNTWFPVSERTCATAVATLTAQFGLALSYIIGPLVVEDLPIPANFIESLNTSRNDTKKNFKVTLHKNREIMKDELSIFLYAELVLTLLLIIAAVVYFPNKPKQPPSISASLPKIDFRGGFHQLLHRKSFWLILFITSSITGVYSGWGAILYVNFKDHGFDITQKDCGWIGFTTTLLSVAGGVFLGYISDKFPGRIRQLLIILCSVACVAFMMIALICQRFIPHFPGSLYATSIIGGFCINSSIPLMYELTIELTYPVPETVSIGLIGVVNNIFTFTYLFFLNIRGIGVSWMNWTLLGTCVTSVLLLGLFREKYRRIEVDQQ